MKPLKPIGLLTIMVINLLICSCAQNKVNFNKQDRGHPAAQLFSDYRRDVRKAPNFAAVAHYFSSTDRIAIVNKIGWHKLPYTISYRALKNGDCQKLAITFMSSRRAKVDCLGSYINHSPILGDTKETMHLRVFIKQESKDAWFISKSGLVHTQNAGKGLHYSKFGLIFDAAISDLK